MEDVQVLKPTIFCGVPRIYDRVYASKTIIFLYYCSYLGVGYNVLSTEFKLCVLL